MRVAIPKSVQGMGDGLRIRSPPRRVNLVEGTTEADLRRLSKLEALLDSSVEAPEVFDSRAWEQCEHGTGGERERHMRRDQGELHGVDTLAHAFDRRGVFATGIQAQLAARPVC